MTSYLENIPQDVLVHIAVLVASDPPFEAPTDLLHLLLTCRTIYNSLCVRSSPHLYARLFLAKFDVDGRRRVQDGLTDSSLSVELLRRHRVLRRIRNRDTSEPGLVQDLWTVLWMILESSGLNETHLLAAGAAGFVEDAFLIYVGDGASPTHTICGSLILWLSVLTWLRRDITNKPEALREKFLISLRPYTSRGSVITSSSFAQGSPVDVRSTAHVNLRDHHVLDYGSSPPPSVFHYAREVSPSSPDPVTAAVILTFALKEVDVPHVPPHLPVDRATAIAAQRTGPTREDYEIMASIRTPLFTDNGPPFSSGSSRRISHDPEFHRALNESNIWHGTNAYGNLLSLLPGVWEGSYMIAPLAIPATDDDAEEVPDFICRKPLQCALEVHLCFSPNRPAPTEWVIEDSSSENTRNKPSAVVSANQVLNCYQDFDNIQIRGKKFAYERYNPGQSLAPWRRPEDALDCVLIGETQGRHEEAWGGFRFKGKISRDGSIILKREPKNDDASVGTWIFYGNLCYGAAFVGRWQSSLGDCGIHGVFSMSKTCGGEVVA